MTISVPYGVRNVSREPFTYGEISIPRGSITALNIYEPFSILKSPVTNPFIAGRRSFGKVIQGMDVIDNLLGNEAITGSGLIFNK